MPSIELSDVQGNILKGFNKPTIRLLFFRFGGNVYATRKWLTQLSKTVPSTTYLIQASRDLHARRSNDPNYRPQDIFLHVSLSRTGLEKLALPIPPSTGIFDGTGKETTVKQKEKAHRDPFLEGMRYREDILRFSKDFGIEDWVEPFNSAITYIDKARGIVNNQHTGDKLPKGTEYDRITYKKIRDENGRKITDENEIDALLIVASDNEDDGDSYSLRLIEQATLIGSVCVGLEIGRALENEQGKQVEHFGFRDGVSQPLIDGIDGEDAQNRKLDRDLFYPEDFVLSGLIDELEWANNGSFLVFRRLRQDVSGFWKFMNEKCNAVSLTPEELAASIVGRWKSGAPLAIHKHDPVDPEHSDFSDFVYSNDPSGCLTPNFAHIKITNPKDINIRDPTPGMTHPRIASQESRKHRILRRAIPYGLPWAQDRDPAADRGLLFICYQRDILEQFEWIQTSLYNSSNYPEPDPSRPGPHDEIIKLLLDEKFKPGLEQWVTATGGYYFFSPPISALQHIMFEPRHPSPHGISWQDWTKRWWDWLNSILKDSSPALDKTGEFAGQNQKGSDVWFLCGTLGGIAHRKCVIPEGASILFPVINYIRFLVEKPELKSEELEAWVKEGIDQVSEIQVEIDGVRLPIPQRPEQEVKKFDFRLPRELTRTFDVTLPTSNIWDLPAGATKAAADGYWIFLRPLSLGPHTIHFYARDPDFVTGAIYDIVVEKGKK